jgi:hypothetical protein
MSALAGGGLRPPGQENLTLPFGPHVLNLYYQIITKNIIRMSQQETVNPAAPDKKQVRKEIGEKLAGALADYKQELGEKKLATRVKEVSKLISRDLRKSSKKQKKDAGKSKTKVKLTKKTSKA